MPYLVEITGVADTSGTTRVFRLSSCPDFMTRPDEDPPNTSYPSRLIAPGNFERHAWARATTRGRSTRGFGLIEIANHDGALDGWADFGFDGQSILIRSGPERGAYPDDYPIVFAGTVMRVAVDWEMVRVYLLDRQGDMADLSFQGRPEGKYRGDNVPPDGVEGLATDLQGKPKPKLRGTAINFAPPCVNTSKLIYQIDDGTGLLPMTPIGVYDRGAALSAGTARASLSVLQSTSPTSGQYDWYAGADGWYVRLGTSPTGAITCSASEGQPGDRSTAQIVRRIVTGEGGFPAEDLDGVGELDAAAGGEVGIWVGEETTVGQVLDALLDSVNAFLTDTREGRLVLGRLVEPAQAPLSATFEAWHIKSKAGLKVLASNDPGVGIRIADGVNGAKARYKTNQDATSGLPVWRVLLDWSRNFTVQRDSEVAGIVASDQARVAFLKLEYRTIDANDASIRVQHAKAPEFTVTTLLVNQGDATAEAARQLALRKTPRITVELPLDPDVAAGVDLMDRVDLRLGRFGWDDGKPFLVIGLIEDYGAPNRAALTTLVLWG